MSVKRRLIGVFLIMVAASLWIWPGSDLLHLFYNVMLIVGVMILVWAPRPSILFYIGGVSASIEMMLLLYLTSSLAFWICVGLIGFIILGMPIRAVAKKMEMMGE